MTRIRSIKPEFYRHVELFDAEHASQLPLRLAFTGLFTCCDREGRFRWQARSLKLDILPYDAVDFEAVLNALKAHGFIIQYTLNNKVYGAIPSWANHQRPSRDEPMSEIPAPPIESRQVYNRLPTQTLRLSLYERDQYHCVYCGENLKEKPRSLCLDYVMPLQQGGSHSELNLATSCKKCNARKGNRTPKEAGLPWPSGLGEVCETPSHPLVSVPDPKVTVNVPHVPEGSEGSNPSLTGGQTLCDPSLTGGQVTVALPVRDFRPLIHGEVTKCQRAYGVEREREGEKEREVEREKEREGEKSKSVVAPARRDKGIQTDVLFVFNTWKSVLGHPQAILDKKRSTWIRQALQSGYSPPQLCEAIRGCRLTPYNMGKNERGQRYDGLHVILKDADQIDRFIHNAHSPPRERNAAEALFESNQAVCDEWLQDKLREHEGVQNGSV